MTPGQGKVTLPATLLSKTTLSGTFRALESCDQTRA
jgi:hypothetical protein